MRLPRTVAAFLLASAALAVPARAALPPIGHVWIVVMENKNYEETFGSFSDARFFAHELPRMGLSVPNYYGITHLSLGNYLAMISGQGSNIQTQADCPSFAAFTPGTMGSDGQALGQGCVYPAAVKTIADQLDAKGLRWKGYMEDMANGPPADAKTCRHPAIGARDTTQSAKPGDQYAARHNPFVYFHSLIDGPACAADDVPLDRLPGDLRSIGTTPSYSFITPNLCHDGHDAPCVDGQPGGLVSEDDFLRRWIPRIQRSPAYAEGGMIIVTYDEAEASGSEGDASACCNAPAYPNTPNPGGTTRGPGGGRTGTIVLSPYIEPATTTTASYNHFSLLRSTEDLFGLGHLGFAARPDLAPFGSDVYNCFRGRVGAPRRGAYRGGTLLGRVRITGRGRRRLLVEGRRPARLTGQARGAGRRKAVRTTALAGCRTYRFLVPRGHGRLTLVARFGRGTERRTLRY